MVDIQQPEGLLMLTNSITQGHSLRYLQPPTKIDAYKYSFFPQPSRYGTTYHHMCMVYAVTLETFKLGLLM